MAAGDGDRVCTHCGREVLGGDLLTVCPHCLQPLAQPGEGTPAQAAIPPPEVEPAPLPQFGGAEEAPPAPRALPSASARAKSRRPAAPQLIGCVLAAAALVLAAVVISLLAVRGAERTSRGPAPAPQEAAMQPSAPVDLPSITTRPEHLAALWNGHLYIAGPESATAQIVTREGAAVGVLSVPSPIRQLSSTLDGRVLARTDQRAFVVGSMGQQSTEVPMPAGCRGLTIGPTGAPLAVIEDTIVELDRAGNRARAIASTLPMPNLAGCDRKGRAFVYRGAEIAMVPTAGSRPPWTIELDPGCSLQRVLVRPDGYVIALGLRPPPDGGREPRVWIYDAEGVLQQEVPLTGCDDTNPLATIGPRGEVVVLESLTTPRLRSYDLPGLPHLEPPERRRPADQAERPEP